MANSKFDNARQKFDQLFGVNRQDVDLYRDTPLRYCGRHFVNDKPFRVQSCRLAITFIVSFAGYSNEVGESFRPLIPKVFVHLSYAVAISYVLAECVDKSVKTYRVSGPDVFPLTKGQTAECGKQIAAGLPNYHLLGR